MRRTGTEPTPHLQPHAVPGQYVLHTADGYAITALRYPAQGSTRARLVVAGATGVAQQFYQAFAQCAALRGYDTLTLDYRGIGLSKPPTLKGFHMAYLDWAHQDLAAAVEYMQSDTLPLFMVGHSFGGHAFGCLPNHHRVAALYTFATGAGWHGWMPFAERLRVLFLWHLAGPLLVWRKGYLAWSAMGMGEDLPRGVYEDWRHWCQFPRYFFDDPEMTDVHASFKTVTAPIVAANALDDLWALPASRNAFMSGYTNAPWQGVDIDPRTLGLKNLGHMGYFRRQAQPLWHDALNWFDTRLAAWTPATVPNPVLVPVPNPGASC